MAKILIDARESGTTTGRYVDKLIEYLHKLKPNLDITILTTSGRLEVLKKLAPKFEVLKCSYKEFTFSEQLGLLKQINSLKPDLVHFPMVQQPVLYRGKVVTTMNDLTTTRFRNPDKNRIIFYIKQQIYKFVNYIVAHKSVHIITYTEFVKSDVAKFAKINSRKVTVTNLAADQITDPPQQVDELIGKKFILYVGRPQPHKNLDRLIESFALLRQDHPELRLVLAGKQDNLYKRLEKQTNTDGVKNVIFTGFVSEGQLRWLYENTVCYTFPSLSEGFGLPGLEAMIHGAPVASSSATCLPEVYKDAAEYFDPYDTNDIVAAIKRVIDDPKKRDALIKKGYGVASKYSWERMTEQTLTIYNDILEGKTNL